MVDNIRIGEINSYSLPGLTKFTTAYRNGIDLAVLEINGAGGVCGRPLEILYRDDAFSPEKGEEAARSLLFDDGVDMLMGVFNSDVALRVAAVATAAKRLYFAGEPRSDDLVWANGSRYVFRLRTSQSMMSRILAKEIATLPARRWALVAPDYGAGGRFAEQFRHQMSAALPDVQWVGQTAFDFKTGEGMERVFDLIDAVDPDGVFAPLMGDLWSPFVRMGRERGAFDNRLIVNPLGGEPEYMLPLGTEAPEGWLVLGYPAQHDRAAANQRFCRKFHAFAGEQPTLGSLIGYMLVMMTAQAIGLAGTVETEAVIDALEGMESDTPAGRIRVRAADHQCTMGSWAGRIGIIEGEPRMIDARFHEGSTLLPSEQDARQFRNVAA